MFFFRNRLTPSGTFHTNRRTPRADPLGSRIITPFFATTGSSDFRTLARISQVPRCLFPHAPPPVTPKSPTLAPECFFSVDVGFGCSESLATLTLCNEAESSSHYIAAHGFASRGFTLGITPFGCPLGFMFHILFTWQSPFLLLDTPDLS